MRSACDLKIIVNVLKDFFSDVSWKNFVFVLSFNDVIKVRVSNDKLTLKTKIKKIHLYTDKVKQVFDFII